MMPDNSSYLEVGIAAGDTLLAVHAEQVLGVDPNPTLQESLVPDNVKVLTLTSDEFFQEHAEGLKFDLIYLDGLHEWKQTLRDFEHSIRHLKPGGVIVIDDVLPTDRWSADPNPSKVLEARATGLVDHGRWYGDVFKTIMAIAELPRRFGLVSVGDKRGGHAQTFVWMIDHPGTGHAWSRTKDDWLEELTYDEVFSADQTPRFYNFKKESKTIYRRVARAARDGCSL